MEVILLFLVCFPFVKWFGLGTSSDVQTYCLIYSFLLVMFYSAKGKLYMNKNMKKLFIFIVVGIAAGLFFTILVSGTSFIGAPRYIVTYLGYVIYTLLFYNVFKKCNGINENVLKISINVYLVVGLVQFFLDSGFMYSWVSNTRTTANRGVISLASEPSFYGYMCIYFLLFAIHFKRNRILYVLNLLFQIFVLAQSSVNILYLMILAVLAALYCLFKLNVKKIIAIIFGVGSAGVLGYYALTTFAKESRMAYLFNMLLSRKGISDILARLNSDGSIKIRFNDIMFCLEGFVDNFGVPHGFSAGKMSSGYGSLIYTMGWFGVLLIIYIYILMRQFHVSGIRSVIPLWITIILFSSIQLSNPIVVMYTAYCIWNANMQYKNGVNIKNVRRHILNTKIKV